ncbi:hypothetical protein GGI12_003819 [Dipsacomyces acuminosporus]|nr:hypothetical protein GGI12_003819 [Dipsacomyces acuminosporus]
MSATQRGTNRTSPNATISQQYDYANLPTEPLAFYVSPFDGLTFEEVVTKIPNINKELEFAYMRRLQELYDLPESFSTDELLAFLRSLINFNKNNTIELVDERLQELSEEQYIGTLEALKGDITKGSLSVNVNLEQLKKDLIKFGVTRAKIIASKERNPHNCATKEQQKDRRCIVGDDSKMVLIAAYVAAVSLIDGFNEERRYFSILKYIVGALAVIPVLYALAKVWRLYKHPAVLLKYLLMSTADVVDRSIFDRLYYSFLENLSRDMMAGRSALLGSQNGRIEYVGLTGYHLLSCGRMTADDYAKDANSTKIIFGSTVWDLIHHLMGRHGELDGLGEFVQYYLNSVYAEESTDIGGDMEHLLRLSQLSEGTKIHGLTTFAEYAAFVSSTLESIFTVDDTDIDQSIRYYIVAMKGIYGTLDAYTGIKLDDVLDCVCLNGVFKRLGEGEFMSTKSIQLEDTAIRIVMQRNISDWHLFYIPLKEREDIRALLELLPSKKTNYEGKLLIDEGGVYHSLSYKDFLSMFALRHQVCTPSPALDTVVYFDGKMFNKLSIAYTSTLSLSDYKIRNLDGMSGWLV